MLIELYFETLNFIFFWGGGGGGRGARPLFCRAGVLITSQIGTPNVQCQMMNFERGVEAN